jgi:nitrate reductase delta subunit
MVEEAMSARLFAVFSVLLDYPRQDLREAAEEAAALVADNPRAASRLGEFKSLVERTGLGRLQELYSATFDLSASSSPYLGYHLFGETYKRSLFLLKLRELYRAHGFHGEGSEMPDHLGVLLRFLAACEDPQLVRETVEEGLLPVLSKITEAKQPEKPDGAPAEPQPARKPALVVLGSEEADGQAAHHQHDGLIEQLAPSSAGKQAYRNLLEALKSVLEARFSPAEQTAKGA